ncbi:MAG TPA: glycosyltransferase family 2 protein, partial [Clostridiales bacterium]|nr:glycosyltransferase family 2 protein [Clostridiales bacterium]
MSQQNITVLLPAYNEGDRIKNTIDALRSSPYVNRIVVIDDGSIDDTFSIAQKSGAIVYRLDKNKGKGYALQYGVQKVIADSDVIVFLDADLADTAREVDKLIIPLLENKADVTIAKFPPAKKKGG